MNMVAQTKQRFFGFILAGAMVATIGMPIVKAEQTWWPNNRQWVIGGGIGVGFTLLMHLAVTMPSIIKQARARKRLRKELQTSLSEVRAWLHRLQEKVDAFPYETFSKEADVKIAQVRSLLTQDLSKHRDTLNYDVERIVSEIDQLRVERDRMIKELDAQKSFLTYVQEFLQSVKDQQGISFLDNVVRAKRDVERMINELEVQRSSLAQHLQQLHSQTHEQNSLLVTQQHAINNLQVEVNNLDMQVVQRRAQLDEAHRVTQSMDREVDQVRADLTSAQQEYQLLRGDLENTLGQLSNYAQTVQADKNALDSQVQQAHYLIKDVGTRINSLQEEVNRQAKHLIEDVGASSSSLSIVTTPTSTSYSSSGYTNNDYSSTELTSYSSKPRARKEPRAQRASTSSSWNSGGTVVKSAVDVLRQALGPFSTGALTDSTSYRKAFLKFTRKNHPDKGGHTGVFQAIDGLYKLLNEKRLFSRTSAELSTRVEKEVINATNAARSVIGRIIY